MLIHLGLLNALVLCSPDRQRKKYDYNPRMRVGNVFSHVCLSVCLSVCQTIQPITFELLHIETSFLVCMYIFTISRSCLSIEVIGVRLRSYKKNDNFTYFNMSILCIWLQVINEVKITHQSEGHIKVKVKISTFFPILGQILLISKHYSSVCGYKSLIRSSS